MEVSLLHIEGETEVDSFEDAVLAGPENVGRLQVGVNNPLPVEDREGGQQILGKLDCQPGRQALSLILEYYLSRVVLQQLQDKQSVASVVDGGVGGDDVGPVVAVRVQDEPLPLDGPVVVAALSEAFQSHDGAVSDSHSLVDNTTSASANLL